MKTLWLCATCVGVLAAPVASAASLSAPTEFRGMCDASAAVALTDTLFAVANDEDNVLRIYDRKRGGMPVRALDLGAFLHAGKKGKAETDLEGSTRVDDVVYWITSHGRDAMGRPSPTRHRLFATTLRVTDAGVDLRPMGVPYLRLVEDLVADPRLAAFRLAEARQLAPKEPGGLNIEGLCAAPQGHLLIGFRNPISLGKALLVPLLNPTEVIAGLRARLGDPILLDLAGLGVRSLGYERDRYFIIAGPHDTGGKARLFEWPGGSAPARILPEVKLDGLNPEGLTFVQEGHRVEFLILSDEGTSQVAGQDCKRLKDPTLKRFHGYLLQP